MRHVAVRRATILLGAGLVLYAGAFAWFVRDEAEPSTPPEQTVADEPSIASGRLLFQRHCAGCHGVKELGAQMRDGGPNARRAAETLLREHGDAADEEDRLILDYLSAPDSRWGDPISAPDAGSVPQTPASRSIDRQCCPDHVDDPI